MRMIIFFDLPTITHKHMVEYRNFRRFLIKNGFVMMQESVYTKLIINRNSLNLVKNKVYNNLPSGGNVQMLTVTENQFAGIEYLRGKAQNKIVDSEDRVILL